MRHFAWNIEKNAQLIEERGISFERIIHLIENEEILDEIQHPNSNRYPNQRMFIIEISNYAYLIPFVVNGDEIFLKTIIPSRKATKKYIEVNDE